jgi:hypothetical protein
MSARILLNEGPARGQKEPSISRRNRGEQAQFPRRAALAFRSVFVAPQMCDPFGGDARPRRSVSAPAERLSGLHGRRILSMRERHRNLIAENLGFAAGNGHRVLEQLYERPIMSVNEVRELTGTMYPAPNQLVERLVKIGVLSEIAGQARNRRYRYDPYVRLFDEPNENR